MLYKWSTGFNNNNWFYWMDVDCFAPIRDYIIMSHFRMWLKVYNHLCTTKLGLIFNRFLEINQKQIILLLFLAENYDNNCAIKKFTSAGDSIPGCTSITRVGALDHFATEDTVTGSEIRISFLCFINVITWGETSVRHQVIKWVILWISLVTRLC